MNLRQKQVKGLVWGHLPCKPSPADLPGLVFRHLPSSYPTFIEHLLGILQRIKDYSCCPSARAYDPAEEGGKTLNKKKRAESIWGNALLSHSASAHPGGWVGGMGVGIMQKQTGYRGDTGEVTTRMIKRRLGRNTIYQQVSAQQPT